MGATASSPLKPPITTPMGGSVDSAVEQGSNVSSGALHHLFVADPEEQPATQGGAVTTKRFGNDVQGSLSVDLFVQYGAVGFVADNPQQVALEVRRGAIGLSEPNVKVAIAVGDVNIEAEAGSGREPRNAPRLFGAACLLSGTAPKYRVITSHWLVEKHIRDRGCIGGLALESEPLFESVASLA